jgi:2-oxo-4-hydroxy-4-carboxy-5-ureidoimidazoline decarboxylase
MNEALARWNAIPRAEAAKEILPCCGSKAWADQMAARRPIRNEATLLAACDEVWRSLREPDWAEAFGSHPRIGESRAPAAASTPSTSWSGEEQQKVTASGEDIKLALAERNRAYERRFNRIFIVCATGKSASEILEILERRLQNDDRTELLVAAEEQRQISHIRLKKWLNS